MVQLFNSLPNLILVFLWTEIVVRLHNLTPNDNSFRKKYEQRIIHRTGFNLFSSCPFSIGSGWIGVCFLTNKQEINTFVWFCVELWFVIWKTLQHGPLEYIFVCGWCKRVSIQDAVDIWIKSTSWFCGWSGAHISHHKEFIHLDLLKWFALITADRGVVCGGVFWGFELVSNTTFPAGILFQHEISIFQAGGVWLTLHVHRLSATLTKQWKWD